jgi:hypothetical protein
MTNNSVTCDIRCLPRGVHVNIRLSYRISYFKALTCLDAGATISYMGIDS